jgi:hypothetical protein
MGGAIPADTDRPVSTGQRNGEGGSCKVAREQARYGPFLRVPMHHLALVRTCFTGIEGEDVVRGLGRV